MSLFIEALKRVNPDPSARRWTYVPYDQLWDFKQFHRGENPRDVGFVIIENAWKPAQRPYHKQKLALILANMRNFALEQAKCGISIKYVVGNDSYCRLLESVCEEVGVITIAKPAERELGNDLKKLVDEGRVKLTAHPGWLTDAELFKRSVKADGRFRMDAFYRLARRRTGVLMSEDKPVGGKFSFDSENRLPWKGTPPAPKPLVFPSDDIKDEVCDLVEKKFGDHPGSIDKHSLPCTSDDSRNLWSWAKEMCLESFGPFEDAMSSQSSGLFHSRVSALLNIGRLTPRQLINDVLDLKINFSSKEGFIRQILGWREFVHHVHEFTDGFRFVNPDAPGFYGNAGRCSEQGSGQGPYESDAEPGASPNFLGCQKDLPPAYWGVRSGFNCLDSVVEDVWREAYSHHITRLMVLSNFGALLDICPRGLTDWFWIAYQDAYDWVVEPNVFGMGLFAVGDLMTTKPYVAGSAYINRMSDYCGRCHFHPGKDCPVTNLYWAYLNRHREKLAGNMRLNVVMSALAKRDEDRKNFDAAVFSLVSRTLANGSTMKPKAIETLKAKGKL